MLGADAGDRGTGPRRTLILPFTFGGWLGKSTGITTMAGWRVKYQDRAAENPDPECRPEPEKYEKFAVRLLGSVALDRAGFGCPVLLLHPPSSHCRMPVDFPTTSQKVNGNSCPSRAGSRSPAPRRAPTLVDESAGLSPRCRRPCARPLHLHQPVSEPVPQHPYHSNGRTAVLRLNCTSRGGKTQLNEQDPEQSASREKGVEIRICTCDDDFRSGGSRRIYDEITGSPGQTVLHYGRTWQRCGKAISRSSAKRIHRGRISTQADCFIKMVY